MKHVTSLSLLLICALTALGQPQYLLKNEKAIMSFYTTQHKRVVIAVDRDDAYIVYRYGTDKRIELEYPKRDTASWRKMQFYWYLQPSMGENNGFDIYNISFVADTFRYVVAISNAGDDGGEHLSLTVLNTKGKILTVQTGNTKTRNGHLIDLRTYEDWFSPGSEEYADPNLN